MAIGEGGNIPVNRALMVSMLPQLDLSSDIKVMLADFQCYNWKILELSTHEPESKL